MSERLQRPVAFVARRGDYSSGFILPLPGQSTVSQQVKPVGANCRHSAMKGESRLR
jgi:hypothetical protein